MKLKLTFLLALFLSSCTPFDRQIDNVDKDIKKTIYIEAAVWTDRCNRAKEGTEEKEYACRQADFFIATGAWYLSKK